jgi:hypothetical protein
MRGYPNCHRIQPRGNEWSHRWFLVNDKRERSRPESPCKVLCRRRKLTVIFCRFKIRNVDDQRVHAWPRFYFKNPGNRPGISCIRAQSIYSFGREGNQPPVPDDTRSMLYRSRIRSADNFGVWQNVLRQCTGWQSGSIWLHRIRPDREKILRISPGACPSNRRGPFYYSDRLLEIHAKNRHPGQSQIIDSEL